MDLIKMLRSDENEFACTVENQPFTHEFFHDSPCVDVDAAAASHKILGFGAAFTDAACYMLNKLPAEKRAVLYRDLFSPEGLNLSIARLNVGSSDYATKAYSYDDVVDDFELKHFSIDHDKKWIIPMVKEALATRPDLYIFSSPWSPPGWMKTSGCMCGGYMRAKYLPVFADYMVAYVKAYQAAGIHINALTMQNEADTDQCGTMPQSLLHPDFEMELVGRLMPERLKKSGLDTKLWLYDHNYLGWKRVLYMLSDPDVAANVDAVGFHPYCGLPEMMQCVRKQYPDIPFQQTEKGPNANANDESSTFAWWGHAISAALNNGCSSFVGWNFALNEAGFPNLGNYNCRGLVEINSHTLEITPSVQYRAFRHYAPYIKRGAEVLQCPVNFPLAANVDSIVVRNPDNSCAAVLSNGGDRLATIQLKYRDQYLKVQLPPKTINSVVLG